MKLRQTTTGFTLIELLMVISIIAIMAALAVPVVTHFRKGDAMLAGTRQMLGAVARARQLAISQHTTVYLVFLPASYWTDDAYRLNTFLTLQDRQMATNLADKQLIAYNFVSLRSIGDQPGQQNPRYLSDWQVLPESTFIAVEKFNLRPIDSYVISSNRPADLNGFVIYGFETATNLPFPLIETAKYQGRYVKLPYIAFNYLGQLVSGRDEYIPLAQGSVLHTVNPQTKRPELYPPSAQERPPGNSLETYNIVHIDALTGRARLERRQIQ